MHGIPVPATSQPIDGAGDRYRVSGYITQSIYVKPTTPPTTIAVIIGNLDGKPGNKRDLKVYLTQTPDDELPRRSVQLSWADDTA